MFVLLDKKKLINKMCNFIFLLIFSKRFINKPIIILLIIIILIYYNKNKIIFINMEYKGKYL